jgi:WD40 repeat protein
MQSKGNRRGRKLLACFTDENRVAIYDIESGEKKEIEVQLPWMCAATQHIIAVTTVEGGLHLLADDGDLVHVIPGSATAECVAFHHRNTNILAMGDEDGSVRMWDVSTQAYICLFKKHTSPISSARLHRLSHLMMTFKLYLRSSSKVTLIGSETSSRFPPRTSALRAVMTKPSRGGTVRLVHVSAP